MENLHAEQFILGCVLLNGEIIKELSLEPKDFGETIHQQMYALMKEIDAKGELVDPATLTMYAGRLLASVGGSDYLRQLMTSVPSVNNYQTYADYVKKTSMLRRVQEKARQILDIQSVRNFEDMFMLISETEEILATEEKAEFSMEDTLYQLNEALNTPKSEGVTGIPTGLRDLDRLLDGWKKQDLNIVAARPSMGKTAFALSLADSAAKHGDYVTLFSLEMSAELLLQRMICMIGGINSFKLKNIEWYFDENDWDKYFRALAVLNAYKHNMYISDTPSPTVQEIRQRVRKNVKQYPDKRHLVLIDYLTLIKGSGKDRTREVGEISRSLKRMARELDVSVIALAQLNRSVEQRQDKRPMMSDIRDSGEVEQDADTISFLYRDNYYNAESEKQNITEIIIAKHRNGPIGTVEVAFLKEYNQFVNLARKTQ